MRAHLASHHIINATILVLVLITLAFAGILASEAYRGRQAAEQLLHANTLADHIIAAASEQAVERGITSTTLGSGKPGESLRQRLVSLRASTEASWGEIYRLAGLLARKNPDDNTFAALLSEANAAHEALADARRRVDVSLNTGRREISVGEWIRISSEFIASGARLREGAFATVAGAFGVAQLNNTLKHRAWLVSEYAGMERGILAYYVAARLPVPAPVLEHLKSLRGVVQRNIDDILALKRLPGTDGRIVKSVKAMENGFLGDYELLRDDVYRAARGGAYPVNADRWWREATRAIGSILGVVAAVTAVVEESAQGVVKRNLRLFVTYIVFFGATLVIAAISLVLVGRTARELFHQKDLAEVTLHSIGDAVITTDNQARIEYINPIAEQLTGWSDADARGRHIREVFQVLNGLTREPGSIPVETCLAEERIIGLGRNTILVRRDGREFVVEDSAAPVRDREGKIVGTVMVFYDVTQMRNAPHLLSYHATHDLVTGLVNRREFERRLLELLTHARTDGGRHALCYIDLDQFKLVNDTCGHVAGDKLLRQVAYILKRQARENDVLARLGGDEFGLLLSHCPIRQAERIADNLRRAVKDFHFSWEGQLFEIGTSIGVVPITPDSVSAEEVLSEADAACYAAKEKGRNRVQVYEPGNAELARRHGEMRWVSRIRQALDEDRFLLYAQSIKPLVDKKEPVFCEILLRLRDEDGEIIPPAAFLPAAERYDLVTAIDRWVIQRSFETMARLHSEDAAGKCVCFNINLSGASLGDAGLLKFIRNSLDAGKIPGRQVCFEITETAAISNLEQATNFFTALKEVGCRFALDDFGTGMSSFSYLKTLPVDFLKIGGGFILNVSDNPVDRAMVDAVIRIGHVMGIKTVAEFVENESVLKGVKELGVGYAQGFHIDRPTPLEDWLAAHGNAAS